jgi:diguanylate cyclase (GGDEF)-like protein
LSRRAIHPSRLNGVVGAVFAAGGLAFFAAVAGLSARDDGGWTVLGMGALLLAAAVAERFPVPVQGVDANGVSLGFVFGVAASVLYGWDIGVIVFALPQAIVHLIVERRDPIRVAFSASALAFAAVLSGLAILPLDGQRADELVIKVALVSAIQYSVNLLLVTAAIAASAGTRYFPLVRSNAAWTLVPFTLMSSAALVLVVLWERSPYLSVALAGPLVAIALYQRSTHKVSRAMLLALTDPLTGLGNHRHFHERVGSELRRAAETGSSVAICFIDVDDFKRINDTYGHPTGDRVLAQVGAQLRADGEAFRLGGDEFALVLTRFEATEALEVAGKVVQRLAELELDEVGGVTVSAGVATFPRHAADLDGLIQVADGALYWAKEHGKNQVRLAQPDVVELADLRRLAEGDRAARLRAASSLARAVAERDTYAGSHSERVAELSARIAARLGLSAEEAELTRLAGSLHDLGKLAIPEELLRKREPLTESERTLVERHPQIGYRMLESLGVDAVALWVLHHHERWDGAGYPEGLAGDQIPLGARIVFVADAYDAMVSEGPHRGAMAGRDAIAELERCARAQFDPRVVEALVEELREPKTAVAV